MVNQAVDCRGRGQGILEDPLPVREDQVAGQQNRATVYVCLDLGVNILNACSTASAASSR